MNVLILGSGGREHAFSWKIAQSKKLSKLFIAPGNTGTKDFGVNVPIAADDFPSIKKLVLKENITMVVVGPEDPLVKGIYDFFLADKEIAHVTVIGPSAQGAQLEGSKEFSKKFMIKHGIPTAAYASFTKEQLAEGLKYLETIQPPFVLKADGLAAGKGVVILDNVKEAQRELTDMLAHAKFGVASSKVVIEQFLKGIELSVFVLTDGNGYVILPSAKDYKRIGEGDTGLNTGGMGAISPVPFANAEFLKKVEERVVIPTVAGLKKEGIDYKGFIFIGLMNDGGDPQVIEYNVRMGDPETEVVMPRIKSDVLELFEAVGQGKLSEKKIELDDRTCVTVMLVAGGYPGDYEKGKAMTGFENCTGSMLFHAGTKSEGDKVLTNGGRILAISTIAPTMKEALAKSFANAEKINYEGKYYRRDIGFDLV